MPTRPETGKPRVKGVTVCANVDTTCNKVTKANNAPIAGVCARVAIFACAIALYRFFLAALPSQAPRFNFLNENTDFSEELHTTRRNDTTSPLTHERAEQRGVMAAHERRRIKCADLELQTTPMAYSCHFYENDMVGHMGHATPQHGHRIRQGTQND